MTARAEINGVIVLFCAPEGPALASEQDALDLMAGTYGEAVDLIAIPVARMAPEFFRLRSGLLGAFVQKLQNYRLRLAFVGDLSEQLAASTALRDFVRESNGRGQVLFVADRDALETRLRGMVR